MKSCVRGYNRTEKVEGAGDGVDKPRFRAAFVTALRLMADQMEGGEKQ